MSRLSKLVTVSILSLLIVSCGTDRTREQKVSSMINGMDAPFFIADLNLQTLMDKSEVMEEGTLPFTYYQVITFFLAKDLTGIDYATNAQFVVGEGESFLPNFYGIFKIENEELFIELIEVEANAEIKEKDGMKYAVKGTDGYCVVWNEEFAVISTIPQDISSMISGDASEQGEKMITKNIELIKSGDEGTVNEDYVAFLKKDADISMMFDGKGFYEYMTLMAMEDEEELEKVKEIYQGTTVEMFLNFNEGSIDLELITELDDELKTQLSFMGKLGVSDKLFKFGKTKSPLLVGTFKVEIDGMMDYFKDMSLEDYDKMMTEMEENGLALEDVKSAMTGEIVYMVDGMIKKEEVYDFGYEEPITIATDEPIFALVIGVGDRGLIETKLQEVMVASQLDEASLEQNGSFIEDLPVINVMENGVIEMGDAYIYLMDDALFMSNDSAWTNMIASGNGVKVDNPKGILNENPIGLYANLSSLMDPKIVGGENSEIFKALTSFSGSLSLDGGKFTIEMADDSQNALKIITVMVGSTLAEFEKNMNLEMEAILEEGLEETEDAFDKLEKELDGEKIEEAVDGLIDAINE